VPAENWEAISMSKPNIQDFGGRWGRDSRLACLD